MEEKKPTIDDIAEELKISKTTVSRAISGKGRISEETRNRVMAYIRERNYKPNAIARGLANQRTYNIGFAVPGDYSIVDLPFFQNCLWGICNYAASRDYDVVISMVKENDISQLERLIHNHKVDGVIIGRTYEDDLAAKFLTEQGVPFVTIGSSRDDSVVQVDNDHVSACKELTRVLLGKGLTRMALIGSSLGYIVNSNRLKGFLEAHKEAGVEINNDYIFTDVDYGPDIDHIVERLIREKIDCIICMDDAICAYVLNKLKVENVIIPRDIRVASFYNSTMLEYNQPAITSLNFDVKEIGIASCKTLLANIDKELTTNKILLGFEVVLKESTK